MTISGINLLLPLPRAILREVWWGTGGEQGGEGWFDENLIPRAIDVCVPANVGTAARCDRLGRAVIL